MESIQEILEAYKTKVKHSLQEASSTQTTESLLEEFAEEIEDFANKNNEILYGILQTLLEDCVGSTGLIKTPETKTVYEAVKAFNRFPKRLKKEERTAEEKAKIIHKICSGQGRFFLSNRDYLARIYDDLIK